jgi:hypothetical protein
MVIGFRAASARDAGSRDNSGKAGLLTRVIELARRAGIIWTV